MRVCVPACERSCLQRVQVHVSDTDTARGAKGTD